MIIEKKKNIVQVGGVRTCFRNYLRCDLHPHCDPVDGSTDPTAEDEVGCEGEYRRKKMIPRDATFPCQSPHHNEDSAKANLSRGVVWTRAILNDDKTDWATSRTRPRNRGSVEIGALAQCTAQVKLTKHV